MNEIFGPVMSMDPYKDILQSCRSIAAYCNILQCCTSNVATVREGTEAWKKELHPNRGMDGTANLRLAFYKVDFICQYLKCHLYFICLNHLFNTKSLIHIIHCS